MKTLRTPLICGLILTAAAITSTLAQLVTWDYRIYEESVQKAKELGHTLIAVTIQDDGSMFFIREGPRLSKADTSTLKDGTMLVSACDQEVKIEGVALSKGEYAIRKDGKFAKAAGRLGRAAAGQAPSPTPAAPPPDLSKRYKWKTDQGFGIGAQKIVIRGTADGGATVSVPKEASVPAIGGQPLTDVPGSQDVRIEIDQAVKKTTYAGLIFSAPCVVDILSDGTLAAHQEGVIAKDKEGTSWTSRKAVFNEKPVIVFFPTSAARPPLETKQERELKR
jgi:hypothetical protein